MSNKRNKADRKAKANRKKIAMKTRMKREAKTPEMKTDSNGNWIKT